MLSAGICLPLRSDCRVSTRRCARCLVRSCWSRMKWAAVLFLCLPWGASIVICWEKSISGSRVRRKTSCSWLPDFPLHLKELPRCARECIGGGGHGQRCRQDYGGSCHHRGASVARFDGAALQV